MRHDTAGEFRGLTGFYFAGRRANRDRKCQHCQVELISGEPVFGIAASFLAINNNTYSHGAYCTPCAVAKMEEMKAKLAEASEWLTAQHKSLESYFVAKTIGGEKDRARLTAMLRKQVPKNLCPRCFHETTEHHHFQTTRGQYNKDHTKWEQVPVVVWKCGYSDAVDVEPNSTVQCCGCSNGPKIKQPEPQTITEEKQ